MLKDFVDIAGPLGVSHFVILSKTDAHVNVRVARIPRGPTVMFHLTNVRMTTRGVVNNMLINYHSNVLNNV